MKAAIDAVPYASVVKIGLQFKRRFWEEDEQHFRRHFLHRPADPPDLLSERRLQCRRQGRAARRLHLRTGRMPTNSPRCRRPSASVALDCGAQIHPQYRSRVRDRHLRRLASRAVHARLRGRMDRRGAPRSTMTISARSTAGSCWRASTPPICRPGRRARSCRRSTRSRACTAGLATDGTDPHARALLLADVRRRRSLARGWRGCARRGQASAMSRGLGFRGAGRRGAVRQCLRRLPPAGRERRERRRRLSGARGNDKNLASADYLERLLSTGKGACRRSAR